MTAKHRVRPYGAGKRYRAGLVVSGKTKIGLDSRQARHADRLSHLVRGWERGAIPARRAPALAIAALLSAALAACSGGGHVGVADPAGSTVGPSTGAPTGPKPAPLVIATASQFPEETLGAQAAANYIDNELGGVDGRPLQLVTCATDGTPERSVACAHQLVDQKPVALVGGRDGGGPAALAVYEAANLVHLGGAAVTPAEQMAADGFRFSPFTLTFPALADFAVDRLGARRITVIASDDVVGHGLAEGLVGSALAKKGAEGSIVFYPANQTGQAAALGQAANGDPDAIVAVTSPQGCQALVAARGTLGLRGALFLPNCLVNGVATALGSDAEGVYIGAQFLPIDSDDADVRTYLDNARQYGASNLESDLTIDGFASVMNAWQLFREIGADRLSAQSITSALRSGPPRHNFMGHPYTCDGTAVPARPAMCNGAVRILQVHGGKLVDVGGDWFDASKFLG